jgi:hypothetical protein
MGGSEKTAASLQVLQGVHSGIPRFAQNDTRLAQRAARTSVFEVRGSHLAVPAIVMAGQEPQTAEPAVCATPCFTAKRYVEEDTTAPRNERSSLPSIQRHSSS